MALPDARPPKQLFRVAIRALGIVFSFASLVMSVALDVLPSDRNPDDKWSNGQHPVGDLVFSPGEYIIVSQILSYCQISEPY